MFDFAKYQEKVLSIIGKKVVCSSLNPEITGVCTHIMGGTVWIDGRDTEIEPKYFKEV